MSISSLFQVTVLKLLAKGAEVDCEDMDGDTPLMLAAANNNTGEFQLFQIRENVNDWH